MGDDDTKFTKFSEFLEQLKQMDQERAADDEEEPTWQASEAPSELTGPPPNAADWDEDSEFTLLVDDIRQLDGVIREEPTEQRTAAPTASELDTWVPSADKDEEFYELIEKLKRADRERCAPSGEEPTWHAAEARGAVSGGAGAPARAQDRFGERDTEFMTRERLERTETRPAPKSRPAAPMTTAFNEESTSVDLRVQLVGAEGVPLDAASHARYPLRELKLAEERRRMGPPLVALPAEHLMTAAGVGEGDTAAFQMLEAADEGDTASFEAPSTFACPRCAERLQDGVVHCPRCSLKVERCPHCGHAYFALGYELPDTPRQLRHRSTWQI